MKINTKTIKLKDKIEKVNDIKLSLELINISTAVNKVSKITLPVDHIEKYLGNKEYLINGYTDMENQFLYECLGIKEYTDLKVLNSKIKALNNLNELEYRLILSMLKSGLDFEESFQRLKDQNYDYTEIKTTFKDALFDMVQDDKVSERIINDSFDINQYANTLEICYSAFNKNSNINFYDMAMDSIPALDLEIKKNFINLDKLVNEMELVGWNYIKETKIAICLL